MQTVMIHMDERQVDLVWRGAVPYRGPDWFPEMRKMEVRSRKAEVRAMSSSGPNRLVYVFPAVAFAAVGLYYIYGAVDRLGLETHQAEARVTGKQVAPGSTTYNTVIAAGRAWTQSTTTRMPASWRWSSTGQATGGAVDPQTYDSLKEGDQVHVQFKRTRFSNRSWSPTCAGSGSEPTCCGRP